MRNLCSFSTAFRKRLIRACTRNHSSAIMAHSLPLSHTYISQRSRSFWYLDAIGSILDALAHALQNIRRGICVWHHGGGGIGLPRIFLEEHVYVLVVGVEFMFC